MPRLRANLLGAAGLGTLIAALAVWSPGRSARDDAAPTDAPSTLFIIARVTKNISPDDIRVTLEDGAKIAKCSHGEIKVIKLRPDFFRDLGVVTGLGLRQEKENPENKEDEILTTELEINPPTWEITLKPEQRGGKSVLPVLTRLEVEYVAAGKKPYTPVNPTAVKDADYLAMKYPGTYVLRGKVDDEPRAFTATKVMPGTDLKPKSISAAFKAAKRNFAIVLPDFKGNRQRLFETIKERPEGEANLVANPFKDILIDQNLTFTLADIDDDIPDFTGTIDRNHYQVEVRNPPRRTAKRVWMLFPLKEAEIKQFEKEYSKMSDRDLVKKIRGADPILAVPTKGVTMSADSKPQWIELTDPSGRGARFARVIDLENLNDIIKPDKFPRVWRFLVYEFDNGDMQAAIKVVNDKGERINLVVKEVEEWPRSVKKALGKKEKPARK